MSVMIAWFVRLCGLPRILTSEAGVGPEGALERVCPGQ